MRELRLLRFDLAVLGRDCVGVFEGRAREDFDLRETLVEVDSWTGEGVLEFF
jgi:hypothetical protein